MTLQPTVASDCLRLLVQSSRHHDSLGFLCKKGLSQSPRVGSGAAQTVLSSPPVCTHAVNTRCNRRVRDACAASTTGVVVHCASCRAACDSKPTMDAMVAATLPKNRLEIFFLVD